MAYGRRKKGGQRLMEMSKAATKKRIAKKNARVGGKKYVTPLPKPKSTAGGRNRTALRTPKGTTIPKKVVKKKVTPRAMASGAGILKSKSAPKIKSDAGQYKGPERFRATPKKKAPAKPTGKKRTYLDDMPVNMKGRESMMDAVKSKGPHAALDAALIAQLIASRGRSPKGKQALSRTFTRLKKSPIGKKVSGLFNRTKPKTKRATAADKKKSKQTEEGYKKFDADRKERSRKAASSKRNKKT